MILQFRHLTAKVHSHIPEKVVLLCLTDFKETVNREKTKLWGQNKKTTAVRNYFYLALYHDITCTGYNELSISVKNWFKTSGNSIRVNTKRIREFMYYWSEQYIEIGDSQDWNNAASVIKTKKELEEVNLWIDSTDFNLEGKHTVSKSNLDWSFKKNSLGCRFMLISDANGVIRYMSDAYPPKTYDGYWLTINRCFMESKFAGATIIGDGHFAVGSSLYKKIKFVTPVLQHRDQLKKKRDTSVTVSLNQKSEKFNEKQRNLRARVENIFAQMQNMFNILSHPWAEEYIQLNYLVLACCAFMNLRKKFNL